MNPSAGPWPAPHATSPEFVAMKLLVPVQRVAGYNVKFRVKADWSCVELANVKMPMKPFGEIAVGGAGTITRIDPVLMTH